MSAKYKALGKNYRSKDVEKEGKNKNLFFPTYHNLTRVLLDSLKFPSPFTTFWEPAAGAGDITKIVKEYYPEATIYSSDIQPRATWIDKVDFLKNSKRQQYFFTRKEPDVIITNPPFTKFMEFFKAAAEVAYSNILFLCPLDYLHGAGRFDTIYKNGYKRFNLHTCYVFERRPMFDKKWRPDCLMPTGATSFCWLNFIPDATEPKIKWLEINKYMGSPTAADETMFQDIIKETDGALSFWGIK